MKSLPRLCFFIIAFLYNYSAYSQQTFSPSQLIADIDSMNKKILEIHPNSFFKIDSTEYFKEIDKAKQAINDSMTSDEFYRLLAPITIKIGDGHTCLSQDQSQITITKVPFPFDIYLKDRHMFVLRNNTWKSVISGSEITKINGIPAEEIISTLLKYIPGESEEFTLSVIENYFPILFRFVYGEFTEFTVELKLYETRTYIIKRARQNIPEPMKSSRLYFNNEVAIIDLRNFSSPDFTIFIDTVFTRIKNKNPRALIIDLRYNHEGQASLADSLISYLTANEYQSMQSSLMKISFATSDYVKELQKMNLGKKKENYFELNGTVVKPTPRKNSFKGPLYILTSPMTYSTAAFFANVVKCYNIGTVIGQETGQPMICYGDIFKYSLPNTKLPCHISKQKFVFCCAENKNQGVIPDYKINASISKMLGCNYEMVFTLDLIKNNK